MPVWAQLDALPAGARAWGLGNASSTLTDVWAVGNNPAGIAETTSMSVGMSYHATPLLLSNFNTFQGAYVQALKKGVLGVHVARFGDKIYSETKAGLAYAYSFQKLNIALKANFVQIAQSTLGSQARATFEFGAQLPLNKYLKFGIHLYNFTQSAFKDQTGTVYQIPTVIRAGLAYQPIANLSFLAEIETFLNMPISPRFGIEYKIHKNVFLRTGLQAQGNSQKQTQTFAQFGGIGMQFKDFQLQYALASQAGLGLGHHVGILYSITKE